VKKFLAVFWLFSISLSATATERRFTAMERSGAPVEWSEEKGPFPQVLKGLTRQGNLSLAAVSTINSVMPYDFDAGRAVLRPALLDDLFYETLMLSDPLGGSERIYPLIAQALRLPDDFSYVVFELDPRARFQDGAPVTAEDILFSLERFKAASPLQRKKIQSAVKAVSIQGRDVRFDLATRGQASRSAIVMLAGLKVVKPNTTGSTLIGGIQVPYTASGPYRITHLGRSRLSLIIDPAYWGFQLPTRKGFFNFRVVDVFSYPDENTARQSLANSVANFLTEPLIQSANGREQQMFKSNPQLHRVEEENAVPGRRHPTFDFNLASSQVQDPRVRQALLLAYDFDGINRLYFGGALQRPQSLLQGGSIPEPTGEATDEVNEILSSCALSALPFEAYGHAQYRQLADKRVRLLTALRLLQESGHRLENGVLKRPLQDGSFAPVQLRMLVRENDARAAQLFRSDLQRLGIQTQITSAHSELFRNLKNSGTFDLVSGTQGFLGGDGWLSPERLDDLPAQHAPCLQSMIQVLQNEPAGTALLVNTAQALARAQQALYLSIFTGEPARKIFYLDQRLIAPPGLSLERLHLYGYWEPPEPAEPNPQFFFWPSGCWDIGCFFGAN